MVVLWLLSLLVKDSSIVDIYWGTGFVFTAWVYFFLTPDGYAARTRRVSGVTMLEKSLKESKPGYKEYVETINAFIPWFPRESSS